MKNCMNVAAGVFGVMVPVALLVCGWNVLAPEKWCWVERGISICGGAIATASLFLFAAGYEHEKKGRVNAPRNARPVFARKDDLSGYAEATSLRNSGKSENAQDARKKGDDIKTGRDYQTEHIPPCQAPAKVGKKD